MDNDIDKQLWEIATFGTIRIKKKNQKLNKKGKPVKPEPRKSIEPQNLPINLDNLPKPQEEVYLQPGDTSRIDASIAKQLKNGDYPIDTTLDLHGLTQDEAFEKLKYFIQAAYGLGKRCILVVTGKGLNGEGVLRQQLPKWLNSPSLQGAILNISQAHIKHGGQGAFYVLLRKNR